jgi:hypothetical protein
MTFDEERAAVKAAVSRFQARFCLRGWVGVFSLAKGGHYVNTAGDVMLVVACENGKELCKCTEQELEQEVVEL